MNYEKILCEFQNFIKAYLSLEHKQHRILDLNLSEVHLLKVAEQNPNYTLIEYEYSCAATPQIRQTGNRLSGLAETAYASLLAQCFV